MPLRCALRILALTGLVLLGGCAGTSSSPGEEADAYAVNDPLEPVNRGVWAFNTTFDEYIFKPVATAYRDYVPEVVQNSIRSFLNNLRSPVIMFNDGLQGQGKLAGDTFARMWLNTILGLGGIMDVATDLGIPFHDADFGQTLGVWGVPAGPYLVLPILGPSDPRDAAGLAADVVADPFNGLMRRADADYVTYGRSVVNGVDTRSRNIDILDRIQSTSLDFYATIRSLYRQRRDAIIRHEAPPEGNPNP
ncbi:MAG TPA: VacJ family lipoprotein [Stellaceae bacterium]|nr:VacJ family lipoprotein [Stellaceae bacterium]